MKDIFKGIKSYDTNQFMLAFDNIKGYYKLFKKYEDRRYKCGYKWLLIGLSDRKDIINELLKNHKYI